MLYADWQLIWLIYVRDLALNSKGLKIEDDLVQSYIFSGIRRQLIAKFYCFLNHNKLDISQSQNEELDNLGSVIEIVESILIFYREFSRHHETLEIVECACQLNVSFPQLGPYDLCRLNYYKAVLLNELNRHQESLCVLSNLAVEVKRIDCPELLDNVRLAIIDAHFKAGNLKQSKKLIKELSKEVIKRFPANSVDICRDTEDHDEELLLKIGIMQEKMDSLVKSRAKEKVNNKPKRKKRIKARKKK